MRISSTDAFDDWANSPMTHHKGDEYALSRLEIILNGQCTSLELELDYAFQAGWTAALANLNTRDI
jgi:hypothetical protein